MNGIKRAGIELDRKVLADLAFREPAAFEPGEQAQAALAHRLLNGAQGFRPPPPDPAAY